MKLQEKIQRLVTLDKKSFETIWKVARDNGLGGKGFSAALRLIVRDYDRKHFDNGRSK